MNEVKSNRAWRLECEALRAELDTLRPAAEALRVAVELNLTVEAWDYHIDVSINGYSTISEEVREDKLAATIRGINRAAEVVKENGK